MPLVVYVGAPDPVMLVKLTLLWVLGICALAFTLQWAVEQDTRLPATTLSRLALIYGAAAIIATLFGDHPRFSILGQYIRYGGLVPQLLYVMTMLLLIAIYRRRPEALGEIADAVATAAMLMSVYVLAQTLRIDWTVWKINGERPEFPIGSLGNSNFAGGYLAIALPLSLYVAIRATGRYKRVLFGIGCGLQCLAIWYTHTRGGLVAAVAALFTGAFLLRDRLPRWVRMAAIATVAAIVVAVVVVYWAPGPREPLGPTTLVRTNTLVNRVEYWKAGWQMFADEPLIGTGPDTFYARYGRYENPAQALREPLTMVDEPHNIFLERATGGGALVLGSYLLLLVWTLMYVRRRLRASPEPNRLLLVSFVASLVAYLIQGFFSIDVPPLAFMGWVVLGGIAVLCDPCAVNPSIPVDRRWLRSRRLGTERWPQRAMHALIIVGAATGIVVGLRPLRADIAVRNQDIPAAIRLQPLEAAHRIRAGDAARARALASRNPGEQLVNLRMANNFYQEAVKMQPGNADFTTQVAALNTFWAQNLDVTRFAVADAWWLRSLREHPNNPDLRNHYLAVRETMRSTMRSLERGAGADPRAWLYVAKGYLALNDIGRARTAAERARSAAPNDGEVREFLASLP